MVSKRTGQEQVIEFLHKLEHPLKNEIVEVRNIILKSNEQLSEHIKWNAPSFCYNNEDRITFNLRGKEYFQLVFHCGAKVKEDKSETLLFEDSTGLLNWITNDRATIKFTNMNDVRAKQNKLAEVIMKWLEAASS